MSSTANDRVRELEGLKMQCAAWAQLTDKPDAAFAFTHVVKEIESRLVELRSLARLARLTEAP